MENLGNVREDHDVNNSSDEDNSGEDDGQNVTSGNDVDCGNITSKFLTKIQNSINKK